MSGAPRAVLDTNVCLDLLLFSDPRTATLKRALHGGAVLAMTNEECRAEWLRVMSYPRWRLTALQQQALTDRFDAMTQLFQPEMPQPVTQPPLPRCGDPDDQKFLVLAQACGARWLISRDNLLLNLARRTRRDGLFDIVSPAAWRP